MFVQLARRQHSFLRQRIQSREHGLLAISRIERYVDCRMLAASVKNHDLRMSTRLLRQVWQVMAVILRQRVSQDNDVVATLPKRLLGGCPALSAFHSIPSPFKSLRLGRQDSGIIFAIQHCPL
jgi:hypothetical protein